MPISGNPGAIPDEDEYQPPALVQQAPQQAATPPAEAAGPPVAFRDVARQAGSAIQTSLGGLGRLFGVQASGAIPTEEDQARSGNGAQRLARGDGAATSEEVRNIDFAGGIDTVQADEGVKQLMRVDRVVNYHLERGDKDSAEAAGVSLLMRGAMQVKQAGSLAAVALQEYQQSGDPNDLKQASVAMQRAHQLIPDGFDLKLDVDPRTRQLVATMTDSEGKAQRTVVDPAAVPGLLKQAMDGSAYWKAVYQLAQPDLAREGMQNEATAAQKASDRAYTEGYDQYKYERERGDKLEDANRKSQEWVDQQQYLEGAGRTAGERDDRETQEYYQDWNERLSAAQDPAEREQVFNEGLAFRYENARDRNTAIEDATLTFEPGSQAAKQFDEEDINPMRNIARAIAAKDSKLDGPGAMEMTAALVTAPRVENNPNGTLNVNGYSLVFNPQLLPMLKELRRKYRVAE
jgi:hypothetical protein